MDNKPKYSKVRWEERHQIWDAIKEAGTLSHLVFPLITDSSISETLQRIYDRGLEKEYGLKKIGILGGSYLDRDTYSLHVTGTQGDSGLKDGDFSLRRYFWSKVGAVVFNNRLNEAIKQEDKIGYDFLEHIIKNYFDIERWPSIKKGKEKEVQDMLKKENIFTNKLESIKFHKGIEWFLFSSYVLHGNYDLPQDDIGIRAMTLDSEREIVPIYSIKPEYISHIFEPIRET